MSIILHIFKHLDLVFPKELIGLVIDFVSTKNFVCKEIIQSVQSNEVKLFQMLHKKFPFIFEEKANIDKLKSISQRNSADEIHFLLSTIYPSKGLFDSDFEPQYHIKNPDIYLSNMIMKCEEKKEVAIQILQRLIQSKCSKPFVLCFKPFFQLFKFSSQEIHELAKQAHYQELTELFLFLVETCKNEIAEEDRLSSMYQNNFVCSTTNDLNYFMIAELFQVDIINGDEYSQVERPKIMGPQGVTGPTGPPGYVRNGLTWTPMAATGMIFHYP